MEICSQFELPLPAPDAWRLLTDLERVAACLPGVTVEAADDHELRGLMRVKVGPISTSYKTAVRIAERDDAALRAVLEASGRESRGQGTANATVTATLAALDGDRTRVHLATDLAITGRVAQFGRGAIGEVADRLLAQFVERLAAEGQNGAAAADRDAEPAADAAPAAERDADPAADRDAAPAAGPLDVGAVLACTRIGAAARIAALAVAVLALLVLLRRR